MNHFKPTTIHNVLADTYNSQERVRIKMRCELPSQGKCMQAMAEYAGCVNRLEELREALVEAKRTIHALHGNAVWEQYQNSPEMIKINTALELQ